MTFKKKRYILKMELILFPNDGCNYVILPEGGDRNSAFRQRPYHEFTFRRISEYLIKHVCKKGNIIDLGAWIGDNSILWALMVSSYGGKVYAIDPSEGNCKYIRMLSEVNNISLDIITKAISDKPEVLFTNDDINHCSFAGVTQGKNTAESTTLDILLQEGKIVNVSYIHLDVEDMEYRVLVGAADLVEKYHPVIAYEIHTTKTELVKNIRTLLNSWGYSIYMINEVLPGCNYDCRNCVAFPPGTDHEDVIKGIETYINQGTYAVVSHCESQCWKTPFTKLTDAMHAFSLLNGGGVATALVDTNTGKVIKQYGIQWAVDMCIRSAMSKYVNMFSPM